MSVPDVPIVFFAQFLAPFFNDGFDFREQEQSCPATHIRGAKAKKLSVKEAVLPSPEE